MAYELFATKADIASFTGKGVEELPVNTDALIRKASDLITNSMIDETQCLPLSTTQLAERTEALKLATCAQVEYWFETGDNQNADQIQSYSAASMSVTYVNNGPKKLICPVARGYLNKQGLLYRGVRLSPRLTERSDESW